mgnify:CR=1 FL=1|jgi:uncharacterized membrane protein YkoI
MYNQFDGYNGYYNYYNSQQPVITIQEAIQIAINNIFGQVIKAELDTENGLLVYEVIVITPQGTRYKIEVDAINGNVVSAELDR